MDDVFPLLARLIQTPSVNPMGQEARGAAYLETALTKVLEEWLNGRGLEVIRQPVAPGRDNLLATYRAASARRHLLLEVHQDTVPATGMTIEPFAGIRDGDRVYGRGACDNKGPMTAMLLALARLARERPLAAPSVTLALTVDEEYTFLGARALVESGRRFDEAIVAEPTELDIVVAHKGPVRWEIETQGRACHSSTPEQGANAIYRAARLITALEQYARELGSRPKAPLVGSPSLAVCVIAGGSAPNIIPDSCRLQVDRRLVPGEDPDDAMADVHQWLRRQPELDFPFHFHPPWIRAPAMGGPENHSLAERLGAVIDRHRGRHQKLGVAFGTDAGAYSRAGIPSVVFGPGSIAQAHTKDEWVSLEQVVLASEILFDFCRASA